MSEISFFSSIVPDVKYPVQDILMYSDGTPLIKQYVPPALDSVLVRPSNLNNFVVAMFLVDSLNESGMEIKNLVLPYVPGARQDRINPTGDVLFTIKSVARMINERKFSRVIILDPHSPVTPALIDRCKVIPFENLVGDHIGTSKYDGVIAPDAGAGHRAQALATVLNVPVIQASKHRDVSTGKLSGFSVKVQDSKYYLVVDDICDGGGTFVGLGEQIRAQGAFADLYVTHGIFSHGTDALNEIYKKIYTTDSRKFHERNRVEIIEVVHHLTEMI